MQLDEWQQKGKYFDFQGHKIFFVNQGQSSTPLLILHGFPTAGWDFAELWPQLTQRFQCILPDMLGYGFSDKPVNHQYSIVEQADIIQSLLDSLGIQEVHILAHDYGNSVAQELLARASESSKFKIRSLAWLNGGVFPHLHRPRPVQLLLASPIGGLAGRLTSYFTFAKGFNQVLGPNTQANKQQLSDLWTLIRHNKGQRVMHKLISYMQERREMSDRWVGALLNAEMPIRMINGLVDPVSGQHLADYYQENVPNADVVRLEGIGHYPQLEAPELVIEALNSFWQRSDVAGTLKA